MNALNEKHVYDLSELTSEERQKVSEVVKNPYVAKEIEESKYLVYSKSQKHWQISDRSENPTTNAKELFYTLENIQVDCKGLSDNDIEQMKYIVKKRGYLVNNGVYKNPQHKFGYFYFKLDNNNEFYFGELNITKTTITYNKFMELFGDKEKLEESYKETNRERINLEFNPQSKHKLYEAYKETSNKLNYELDFNFITQLAERMAQNKHKYEPYNWQKLDNVDELKQALFRHVLEVMNGNYEDDNRLFGHLESIALNAMFINYQFNKNK